MNRMLKPLALLALAAVMAAGGGEAASAASWDRDIGGGIGRPIQKTGSRSDQDHAREAVREGRILPLGKVLAGVQQQYPGRLLDADLVDSGGRPIYLIKLMTRDGNVAIVTADAATGRILGYRQGGH
jgi:uncharacterized membrane protein YkoI